MSREELEALIAADLSGFLDDSGTVDDVIEKTVQGHEALFREKLSTLEVPLSPDMVNTALAARLLKVEERLRELRDWGDTTEVGSLKKTADYVLSLCPQDENTGLYLKEGSAQRIIRDLPPENILEFARANPDTLPKDARSILALTRHTESKDWQARYMQTIEKLRRDDFESAPIAHHVYDSDTYEKLLSLSGERRKPWRVSHNKETGIINVFALEKDHAMPASLLLTVAILMHYYFEATTPGKLFSKLAAENEDELGKKVAQTILSNKHRMSGFNANTYSEHVYWERALEIFERQFPGILGVFEHSLYLGGRLDIGKEACASMNMIDVLWDVNLLSRKDSATYFSGGVSGHFLYHWREALWYDVLRRIAELSETDMRTLVLSHIHVPDQDFTKGVLERRLRP